MRTFQKPQFIRSRLNIVIDGMTQEDLLKIGHQLSALSCPPVVSLYKMLPVHNDTLNARLALAQATSDLGHLATHKIVHGSNPSILDKILNDADATMVRNQNGKLALFVNNPNALGINELMASMPYRLSKSNSQKTVEKFDDVRNRFVYKNVFSDGISLPIKSTAEPAVNILNCLRP